MQIVNETVRYDIKKLFWNKNVKRQNKTQIPKKKKKEKTLQIYIYILKMSFLFIYTIVFVVHSNHPEKDEQHPDKL